MKNLDGAILRGPFLRGQTILRISTLSHDQKWEAGDKNFPNYRDYLMGLRYQINNQNENLGSAGGRSHRGSHRQRVYSACSLLTITTMFVLYLFKDDRDIGVGRGEVSLS